MHIHRLLLAGGIVGVGFGLWFGLRRDPAPASVPVSHAADLRGSEAALRTAKAPRKTAIPRQCPADPVLTLAGTAIIDGGHRIALLRTPRTSRLVTLGQTVDGGVVRVIERRTVMLQRGDRQTCVSRRRASTVDARAAPTRSRPIRSLGAGRFAIQRAWLKAQLEDHGLFKHDIRLKLIHDDRNWKGFDVARVRPGGVFHRLGLRKGDVLLAANGQPFDNPNRVLKLYGQLPDADVVRLRIRRGGKVKVLDYEIE